MADVYQMVTDRIIKNLEEGKIPWKRPWKGTELAPKNFVSRKPYKGFNLFMLAFETEEYFLTFNQAKKLGGHIKAGAKGLPVIYWNMSEVKDPDDPSKTKKIPFLKYYTVFALADTEGIERPIKEGPVKEINPIEECDKIIDRNKPDIRYGGDRAFFRPSEDIIGMPHRVDFDSAEHFYATLFHELIHWSGHKSRLDRITDEAAFGNEHYSKEELVAELGSAFLAAMTGTDNSAVRDNEAAYIASWLAALRDDKRLIISASGKAQKAVEFLTKEEEEEEIAA